MYGIGAFGVAGSDAALAAGDAHPDARKAREAEARQLKGYLLFFEQLLADYLAQLEHAAPLYSFLRQDQTYFAQPLVRPGSGDPDEPPDIAPVLGEVPRHRDGGGKTNPDWFETYLSGLNALTTARDVAPERQNRALDHMLARFNERFDTDALWRLTRDRQQSWPAFLDWLGQRKRRFLSDFPTLSARRGIGVDLLEPDQTALERRIALKTGIDGDILIVEHQLLRDLQSDIGIGGMQIGCDFFIQQARPARAFRVAGKDICLHLIVDQSVPGDDAGLGDYLCVLGASRGNYRILPPGGYQLSVRLDGDTGVAFEVLENFRSHSEAETAITRLIAVCRQVLTFGTDRDTAIRPAILPAAFFRLGVSVFLPDQSSDPAASRGDDFRAYVERVVGENIRAHLDHVCFWLTPQAQSDFRKDWHDCVDALGVLRRTARPSKACRARAAMAAGRIRQWIDECYCRDILRSRRAQRRAIRQGRPA